MQISSSNLSMANNRSIKLQQRRDNSKNKQTGNSVVDELEEQKESLAKRKSELIDDSLKNKSYSSVKDEINQIDKQIEDIDKKIADVQKQETKKSLNKTETDDKKNKSKKQVDENSGDSTAENNITTEQMSSMLNIHADIRAAKTVFNLQKSGTNRIAVLQQEIKSDLTRRLGNPAPKRAEISELNDKIDSLSKTAAEKIKDINKENSKVNNSDNKKQEKDDKTIGSTIDFAA